jgi:Protein of unknown function (DUF1570)
MMKALLLVMCSAAVAAASPTPQDLQDRAAALNKQLAGTSMTVLVESPFVVVGDMGAKETRRIATGFLRSKTAMLEKDFFPERPDKLIEVWLFKNEKSFRAGAKKFFDDTPDTPFGYYSPEHSAMIMNANGLGTLSHELVHPYMEKNFPNVPSWFNEGLASLYEYPGEAKGHIIGHVNWRLPELKREIKAKTLPTLVKLMHTTTDEFYEANWDAYAQARYLCYYLQEHGKLHAFYDKFHGDTTDESGQAALEAVVGEKLADFEPKWREWVLAISKDPY